MTTIWRCASSGTRNREAFLQARHEIFEQMDVWRPKLDPRPVAQVAFYLIIPPLAWVGAALVERLVEGMIS